MTRGNWMTEVSRQGSPDYYSIGLRQVAMAVKGCHRYANLGAHGPGRGQLLALDGECVIASNEAVVATRVIGLGAGRRSEHQQGTDGRNNLLVHRHLLYSPCVRSAYTRAA